MKFDPDEPETWHVKDDFMDSVLFVICGLVLLTVYWCTGG